MKSWRSPLMPWLVALLVMAAVGLATQMQKIGWIGDPRIAKYHAPDAVPRMSETQSDFSIILHAGSAYLSGFTSDADVRREAQARDSWDRLFPYPPIVYRLSALLIASCSQPRLAWLLAFPIIFALALAFYLTSAYPQLREHRLVLLGLAGVAFCSSASALLQMERGNFDWLVISLYLGALSCAALGSSLLCGALLGLAIALKLYPLILLPFLIIMRRMRAVAAAILTLIVVVILTGPRENLAWLRSLRERRVDWLKVHVWNTSLANLKHWAGRTLAIDLPEWLSLVVFTLVVSAMLLACIVRLRRRAELDAARIGILLVPFMFLIPATTWGYTLFSLLPILFLLSTLYERQRLLSILSAIAIGLCQSSVYAFWTHPGLRRMLTPIFSLSLLCLALLSVVIVWRGGGERSSGQA